MNQKKTLRDHGELVTRSIGNRKIEYEKSFALAKIFRSSLWEYGNSKLSYLAVFTHPRPSPTHHNPLQFSPAVVTGFSASPVH